MHWHVPTYMTVSLGTKLCDEARIACHVRAVYVHAYMQAGTHTHLLPYFLDCHQFGASKQTNL